MTIVILGMHRSGTSCIARMLSATGPAIRNWDNARGHFELLDLVRLDEAVLAYSGGHWLAAPTTLRWTDAHAAERDRLLASGLVLKDPRMLLALPFWRASAIPFQAIGVVRHPLAVARSLASWRGMPLDEGIALWLAHNRPLAALRPPIIDFDRPKPDVVAALEALVPSVDASAYEDELVHHDATNAPNIAGLDEALALHADLVGQPATPTSRFPHAELAAFHRDLDLAHARSALAAVADRSAVLVPIVTALIRARRFADATCLVDEHAGDLADLLHAKILLASGDAPAALRHLEAACAQPSPYYQARALLPQALRAVGRTAEARAALHALAADALYPHGPLATLAEWSFLDGERTAAIAEMAAAIAAAPPHRRGRLRTRRAEWLAAAGDIAAARAELELAIAEDPGYVRSTDVLARITRSG